MGVPLLNRFRLCENNPLTQFRLGKHDAHFANYLSQVVTNQDYKQENPIFVASALRMVQSQGMRHTPTDKWDREELKKLNAEPWQIDLLKLNPAYCSWGPHEDYMSSEEAGWASRCIVDSWDKCGFALDDLNECVNFYFELARAARDCCTCGATGYHPDALWISESFYSHSSPFKHPTPREVMAGKVMERFSGPPSNPLGFDVFPHESVLLKYGPEFRMFCEKMANGSGEWSKDITEDEKAELVKHGREPNGDSMIGHDAINRCILIEQRCRRFGVPLRCPECKGDGSVFTASQAHVNLILWIIHPRKGCSRGVEIKNIKEAELPEIFKYLRHAADRNANRFSKIP